MTAQVMFINTFYYPEPKEVKRLEWLQIQLELYHAEIAYQSRTLGPHNKMIFKESSHNQLRQTWRVIDGELCNNLAPDHAYGEC